MHPALLAIDPTLRMFSITRRGTMISLKDLVDFPLLAKLSHLITFRSIMIQDCIDQGKQI
ncbi:unnamed protein product [Penicillium camemberti]|uniref:Str. FM013 n=1 Tax=Penicillium camemberti (strain FM 013) TaxID=1429867 RepID=A0A0G4P784_PENC3|nr:unnamed protein product [Penicillium camemberti]